MGLGINVAFSFFMKHIYMYLYTHKYIHVPNLLNGHAIVSIKKSRRKDDSRVSHTRRPQDSGPAGEAGARCAASRFYLVSRSRGRAAPGGQGEGTGFPSRQQGPHFPAQPSDRAGPADPSGSGMATFAETREKDNTFGVLDGLLVSIGDCSPATQAGRRELCDEPAALSPDGASRSPRPRPGHPLRWADGWRGAGCGEPAPAPHGLS